ncbi:hypothetical protein PV410_43125 [Streptomyces sp. PA03-5A]|nr:hypothetical protein [Streptomyces sp. PA03-5A]
MARSGPSPADQELIAALAEQGLQVSLTQLERWRLAGLLPRHERHYLGRGRGSVSVLAPATVQIAAVLARHARQGRDLRWAVLDWFAEAGRAPATPEPPDHAVCAAVVWAVENSPIQRLLQQARAAHTDQLQDAFYAAAEAIVPAGTPGVDVVAMRASLLGGGDVPPEALERGEGHGLAHLIAVLGMGYREVGADALALAMASTGAYPQMSAEDWAQIITDLELTGALNDPLAEAAGTDPLSTGRNATADELRAARAVYYLLGYVGSHLVMHALLMPDTPAQAALRATVERMGMTSMLMVLATGHRNPRTFADHLVACLQPDLVRMHDELLEQVTGGPSLMDRSGGQAPHDPEQFMKDWIATLTALA